MDLELRLLLSQMQRMYPNSKLNASAGKTFNSIDGLSKLKLYGV